MSHLPALDPGAQAPLKAKSVALGPKYVPRCLSRPEGMAGIELPSNQVEIHDITDGLWIWRLRHPHWREGVDWQPTVTCVCVESGDEVVLLDPLLPPLGNCDFWTKLGRRPPTAAVVLKPDHVRDIDLVVRLFPIRAFGPSLFWPNDVPRTELEPVEAGAHLPGGLEALYDGRGKNETPLWLPAHRTIVFADALTERDGQLLVWNSRLHRERALPALQSMLELPFERVIISHGHPVHDRAAFERALTLPPWTGG